MSREAILVAGLMAAYAASLIVWLLGALARRERVSQASVWIFAASLVINTAIIGMRWVEAGRAPFKTLYETLLFYPWCVAVVTLVLLGLYRLRVLIPLSAAACLAGLAYARMKPDVEIVNLPPALQSAWFVPHVVTYFIAYAALFTSFALAILALVRPQWRSQREEAGFADYAHRSVEFGFMALTLGLVMGSVWGKFAWGDYWAWDPKENWALVTWLAYLVYLHGVYIKGWRGRPGMVVCVLAFVAVMFTYLGMNLLPSASGSLHVYQ
ncbi:MAG: cytochrome c biogenesis protein CcsA [Planctomycetes bacterium]|nr:cytochrome c biogenesis protein CcsA [Planctomycetota bacterium]